MLHLRVEVVPFRPRLAAEAGAAPMMVAAFAVALRFGIGLPVAEGFQHLARPPVEVRIEDAHVGSPLERRAQMWTGTNFVVMY